MHFFLSALLIFVSLVAISHFILFFFIFFIICSIACGMFGSILSYIIIIGSLCENILLTYMDPKWYTTSTVWSILLVGLFVLPMSCIRDFGHLAYVSFASVATIIGTILVVLIIGSREYVLNEADQLNYGNFQGSMQTLGTVVFAFNYSSAIFHAYQALQIEDRNVKTFSVIARQTTFLGVMLSFLFGLIGYLSFRSSK